MMIQELYRALLEQGATAQHHQGEVKLHLPKALDAALKQQLIARKDELKQYLLGLYASASLAPVITPVERTQAHFPLSSAQQRLWFLDQLQGNTIEYNMSAAFTVSGEFDLAVLEQTMQSIVARHEVLRTRFIEVEGEGKQQLVSAPAQLVSSYDLSDLTASAQQTQLDALLAQEAAYAFDLSTDSLIRVHYVTLSPQQGVLMFNLHHIVSDGYSVALLVKEFSHTYSALVAGQEPELAPLSLHYIDYAHWQQNEARTHYQTQLDYWVKQLSDAPEVHTLPVTGQRDTHQHPAQKFTQQLPEHQAKAIADSAEALQLSPFAFLHALLSLVVARHSHSQDIVIGTPVENRLQSGLQSLQGFFVNTVPLRVSTEFDTLTEYFEHVKGINQQALANQELPLDQLIEGLQISRSQVHAPLFQILLTVEGTPAQPVNTQFNVADVQLTQRALPVTSSKFDLDINLVFNEQGLALNWVYDSHLFTADYITKLSTHLSQLIAAFVPQNLASLSQQSPQQIDMLSEQERQHLVYDVQSETLAYNAELSLHEQISRQAQLTPDAIAIDMPGGRTLSYAQLDAGANRIAAYLQQHYSLSADSMVGVSTVRHAEMVMAILAILKTGAAYLPLDPGYPSARLAQIIDDAKPVVTLTDNPAILQGLTTDTLS
ncbi:condensation domain-containing protein, partial [Pseudoalteromonas sp. McH1-42]|uniref:condensation domain-containing protein n=1 Tax=Pseudoalteromonas sp. McH1-42 TaxID=2917752 RepID=UPI001EF3D9E0